MYCIFLKDVVLVFVHVMTNGLLKVKLVGHQGKLVLPLINDMVIPKKCLGPLVEKSGGHVIAYNNKSKEACTYHWSTEKRIGKKFIMGLGFTVAKKVRKDPIKLEKSAP